MRVTQATTYLSFLRDLQIAEARTFRAQSVVSSGKKVHRPSDDPAATTDILRLSAENAEDVQFARNLLAARSRLETADGVLDGVGRMVERVRSLALLSLTNPATAHLYTAEIDGLRDQILAAANTAHQGTFLFSGTASKTMPFVKGADDAVTYAGNSTPLAFQVRRTLTLDAQVPGDEIFGGTADVFAAIADLSTAMQAGDFDGITGAVETLEQYYDVLAAARSRLGSTLNLAENLETEHTTAALSRARQLDALQSADMAQAISELMQSQTGLQATLAVGARLSQLTLLDYMR